MKYSFLSVWLAVAIFSFLSNPIGAQVYESCDCTVDIDGYSAFLETLSPDEDATFQFHVHGTFAVAYGVIGSTTPSVVQDLIDNSPNVTTIVMHSCPGSENDDANLEAAQLIHDAGYKMYLPDDGFVASGAVDMFLAGTTRVIDATIEPVGVHAWSDGTNEATDFPVGNAVHQPYIDYYISMGFSQQDAESFYYFTINAAPASDIYWMTESELNQYKIRTCIYSDHPEYTVTQQGDSLMADLVGVAYQWVDCDNGLSAIDGETNQSFAPNISGNFAVQITENNCVGTSSCQEIVLGVLESNFRKGLEVYPNPTFGDLTVVLGDTYPNIQVTTMDESGLLINKKVFKNQESLDLSIHNSKGIYLILIESGAEKAVVRVWKE